MLRLPITENDVKEILKNRERLKVDIHRKMYAINKDLFQTEEMYELVAYPSSEVSDMPRRKGWHKDLGDVVLKYKALIESRKIEYQDVMWTLILQEESIERVWLCFLVMAQPYYTILEELYVKGEKYEVVENKSGYSSQVFEKHRKNGVNFIIQLYNSEHSIADLTAISQKAARNRKEIDKKKLNDDIDHQIRLEDIFDGLT